MSMFRIGQNNGAGDVKAKFLKVFSGEVLEAYNPLTVARSRVFSRSITHGKEAQFPVLGRINASYFDPMTNELVGSNSKTGERTISIDPELLVDLLIPSIDEAFTHFDYRQAYVVQMAEALARTLDVSLLSLMVLASRAVGVSNEHINGTQVTEATGFTSGAALESAIMSAAAILDDNGTPETERSAFFKSLQYTNLYKGAKSMELETQNAGNGSLMEGTIRKIAGVEIVKARNAPWASNYGGSKNYDGTDMVKYAGNFTNTVGVVQHKGAVGELQLLDVSTQTDYLPTKRSWLTVSALLNGMGVLRPESAVEIATVARA